MSIEDNVPHLSQPIPVTFGYDILPNPLQRQVQQIVVKTFEPTMVRGVVAQLDHCAHCEHLRSEILLEFGLRYLSSEYRTPLVDFVDFVDFWTHFDWKRKEIYLYSLGLTFKYMKALARKRVTLGIFDKAAIEQINDRFRRAGVGYEFGYLHSDGRSYDIDYNSREEGTSRTLPTYAAVTARSFHPQSIHALFMDGSVKSLSDHIDLTVWRALGTRSRGDLAEGVPSL